MRRRETLRHVIAGFFFFTAVGLTVGVVFVLGVERGLTEPRFPMRVLFHEVGGLAVGAPVRLSGVTVGTVSSIDILDKEFLGRGVEVRLSLFKRYERPLRKSRRIAIITEGVLGEKIVEITTDPDYRVVDFDQPVVGVDPLDVQGLAETFGEAAEALLETSQAVDGLTKDVEDIARGVRRLLHRVEQRIIEGTLFKVF